MRSERASAEEHSPIRDPKVKALNLKGFRAVGRQARESLARPSAGRIGGFPGFVRSIAAGRAPCGARYHAFDRAEERALIEGLADELDVGEIVYLDERAVEVENR